MDGLPQCPDGSDEILKTGDPFLDSMRTGSEDTNTTSPLGVKNSAPCLYHNSHDGGNIRQYLHHSDIYADGQKL